MADETPRSLEEAVNLVLEQLGPEVKERLRGLNTEGELLTEAIRSHHGLGRDIRSACGLWSTMELLRSIAGSRIRKITRQLSEDRTLTLAQKCSLDVERGYLERCRKEDFFHPDDFSVIILREVWRQLKTSD